MSKVKVVYNSCYGGFGLSAQAKELGRKMSGDEDWGSYHYNLPRHDPILVEVVEKLGDESGGSCAHLEITEVEEKYRIDEYDGYETVETPSSYDWVLID